MSDTLVNYLGGDFRDYLQRDPHDFQGASSRFAALKVGPYEVSIQAAYWAACEPRQTWADVRAYRSFEVAYFLHGDRRATYLIPDEPLGKSFWDDEGIGSYVPVEKVQALVEHLASQAPTRIDVPGISSTNYRPGGSFLQQMVYVLRGFAPIRIGDFELVVQGQDRFTTNTCFNERSPTAFSTFRVAFWRASDGSRTYLNPFEELGNRFVTEFEPYWSAATNIGSGLSSTVVQSLVDHMVRRAGPPVRTGSYVEPYSVVGYVPPNTRDSLVRETFRVAQARPSLETQQPPVTREHVRTSTPAPEPEIIVLSSTRKLRLK